MSTTATARPATENDDWLPPPEQRRSLAHDAREIAAELWTYRGLALELVRRDLRVRYKQTAMGFGWALLTPILIVSSGMLVRFAMAYVGGREPSTRELAGIAVKAVPWSFFVGALGFATQSLTSSSSLITKIYFPREVLPLAATIAHAADACVGALVVVLVSLLLGLQFGTAALWVPVLAACLFLFTAGAGLLASCGNLFLRDVKYLVQVCLMFGIFLTPVFFEPQMFGPYGARLMMLNPIAPLLEGIRLAAVEDHALLEPLRVAARAGTVLAWSPWYLAYGAVCSVVVFLVGLVTFHRAEGRFAEYV
jgi:ABC-type polysaccharide/polyol phosphate export permease